MKSTFFGKGYSESYRNDCIYLFFTELEVDNFKFQLKLNIICITVFISYFPLFSSFICENFPKNKMAEDIERAKDLAFAKAAKYISSCLTVSIQSLG